jgi:hypothetical protein
MPVPSDSSNFADILDIRFQRIFDDEYDQIPDMLPELFGFEGTNGREDMRFSSVGTMPDWNEFTGSVTYQDRSQGYDTVMTPLEFASGFQVRRKLFDDDQFGIMDARPRSLASSYQRTRQSHGARIFSNAFSSDTYFYNNSEGVALCSASHTTTTGASTTTGFDNLGTAALTATAVAAARIQARKFRGDQAELISVNPDELLYPTDLYERAFEIISAGGKLDVATNNPNVHQGAYRGIEWEYLTDTNNWFMMDGDLRRQMLKWTDRLPVEFAMVEDFDTIIAKWRGYARYANSWVDWRFVLGNQVS